MPRMLGERGDAHLSPCLRARAAARQAGPPSAPCALFGVLGLSEPGSMLGLVLFCRLFASCPLWGGDSERLVWEQCCQLRCHFLAWLYVQKTACRWRRHRYVCTQRTAAFALLTPESSNGSSYTCTSVSRVPAGGQKLMEGSQVRMNTGSEDR